MPLALIWCWWPHNLGVVATMLEGGRKIEREEFNQELAVELTGETEVLTGVGQCRRGTTTKHLRFSN